MSRKRRCKFDSEWEQALSLLNDEDARKARLIIENYQQTGEIPHGIESKFEMILLLVKPLIDRRRRATESTRRRRLLLLEHPAIAAYNKRKRLELKAQSISEFDRDYSYDQIMQEPEKPVEIFKPFNMLRCRPVEY